MKIETAINRIEKCNGDCKKCNKLMIPSNGTVYAFLCGIGDRAGMCIMSNTIAELRNKTLDGLRYEIS